MRNARGSVLILALWALSLLAVFSVSLGIGARQKASLLNRIETEIELHSIASAGIMKASGFLKQSSATPEPYDSFNSRWANDKAYFRDIAVGAGMCSVMSGKRFGLEDENSKIPLNTADQPTLARLIKLAGGTDSETAEAIAYAIVDWRDTDSALSHPQMGAEDPEYADLRLPYEAKDAAFEVIDELLLVKGMTRPIFDKIKGYLTPCPIGHVNIHTAPREVLIALGIEERIVDKILIFRKGGDEEEGTSDDGYFAQVTTVVSILATLYSLNEADQAALEALISNGALGTTSTYFSALCQAKLERNGSRLNMEATMDSEGKIISMRPGPIEWPA